MIAATKRKPCPICDRGPKDRALAVTFDDRGAVSFCHRCGYVAADNHVSALGSPAVPKLYRPWRDRAEHIWGIAEPLAGSLAATYLTSRGCFMPPADGDLRFLPARGDYPAAMLARVTDARSGEPISLHFTRLDANGRKAGADAKRLLSGHRKAGGVIRLWPDDCVTVGLGIGEGIESCLAAAHGFTPMWSMVDAGNLARFPILSGIQALTIFADNDLAGVSAARACARRWAQVAEVTTVIPDRPGADMCDVIAA
jgi:hypothetical protein